MLTTIAFCLLAGHAYSDGTDCPSVVVLPPCAYEDSDDCHWHAQTRGNGMGQSFVNVNGTIYKWDGIIH